MWTAQFLLLLGARLLAAPAGEAVELRLHFPHGQQLRYQLRVEQSSELVLDLATGETRRARTATEAELLLRAQEADDSGSRLEVTFGSLKATQNIGGRQLPVAGAEELRRARLGMRISTRGEVSEAELLNPAELPEPARRVAASLCHLLEQMTLPLPESPQKASASWPIERRWPLLQDFAAGISLEVSGQTRLARLESCRRQHCARLEAELSLKLAGSGEARDLSVLADLGGQGKATVLLALETGQLLKSDSRTEISGVLDAGQAGERVRTRVRLQSAVQLELIR